MDCLHMGYVSSSGGAGHPSGPISIGPQVVCGHFANYDQFSVGDEDSEYTLSVSGYQSASTAVHRTPFSLCSQEQCDNTLHLALSSPTFNLYC